MLNISGDGHAYLDWTLYNVYLHQNITSYNIYKFKCYFFKLKCTEEDLNRHFTKGDMQIGNKFGKNNEH